MDKYRLVKSADDDATVHQHQESQSQSQSRQTSVDASTAASASASMSTSTTGKANQGIVRITQQGKPRNYISYAMKLFNDKSDTIVLKAMGRAINKAVTIAEILKRKMPLHQVNALSSKEMVDVFEPLEEGLDTVTSRRYVSCMQITLSKTLDVVMQENSSTNNNNDSIIIDVNDIGYQPPLPIEEMNPGDFHPLREAALLASAVCDF